MRFSNPHHFARFDRSRPWPSACLQLGIVCRLCPRCHQRQYRFCLRSGLCRCVRMTVLALAPSCYDDNDDDDCDFDYHYDYDDDFAVTSASSMAAATRKDATHLASASLAVPLQMARLPENVPLWMRSPRNNDPHHHPTPTITKANNR